MKKTLGVAAMIFCLAAVPASATTPAWTAKDMQSAARGLGYPKPHPKKLTCKTSGGGFRCVATYRHHRRNRFYIESVSGPFLCAGKTLAACKTLRRGFVTNRQLEQRYGGTLPGAAEFASRAYMAIHYNDPQPFVSSPCPQTGTPSTWTFCYKLDTGSVSIDITLKHVKTGYVTTASERLS